MWKTICKVLVLVMLLGYVSVAFALARLDNDRRVCPGIDLHIEGNSLPASVLEQGVRAQLKKYNRKIDGEKVENIDLRELENYLSRFSNFENVECSFNPDSRLRISITPIKAEVRVFEEEGSSFYVNRAGKRINADAEFFIDVPVLIASKATDPFIPDALPVIRFVGDDPELGKLIAAFKIDGAHDVILIPKLHGHVINFGDSTRMEQKKQAILTAYRTVLPVKGWNTYDTISVKFRNQIVASRRDKRRANDNSAADDGEDLEESALLANTNLQNNTEETHP